MGDKNTDCFRAWFDKRLYGSVSGTTLGTIGEFAARWNINERTIRRHLRTPTMLARAHAVPGRGIVAGPLPAPALSPIRPPDTAGSLADSIAESIRAGKLKRGETIPAIKTLAHTYHVSATNAGRACVILCQRGLLIRIGKRHQVATTLSIKRIALPAEVVIFHRHSDTREVMSLYDHHFPLTEMELELLEYGVRCRWQPVETLARTIASWNAGAAAPLGVVFTEQTHERYLGLAAQARAIRSLDSLRTPQVLFIGERINDLPRDMHMLCGGTTITANVREAAQFAVRGPFDRVALVLETAEELSVLIRIETELAHLGFDTNTELCVSPSVAARTTAELFALSSSQHDPRQNLALFERYLSSYSPRTLSALAGKTRFPDNLQTFYASLPARTLCVFTSDSGAAKALELCRLSGRAVPRDIALLGSGNDHRFFHCAITTCIPDWRTIGYLMAHALLDDITVPRGTSGFLRVSARILERGTTS